MKHKRNSEKLKQFQKQRGSKLYEKTFRYNLSFVRIVAYAYLAQCMSSSKLFGYFQSKSTPEGPNL